MAKEYINGTINVLTGYEKNAQGEDDKTKPIYKGLNPTTVKENITNLGVFEPSTTGIMGKDGLVPAPPRKSSGSSVQYLGDDAEWHTIATGSADPIINSRLKQTEREIANIVLKMEAENMMPDCNMLLAEDFVNPDSIDMFETAVINCSAGSNIVEVASNAGIIIGSWYWLTDGINTEYIQVSGTKKEGNTYSIILTENLTKQYTLENTYIYRTTAYISDGIVYGSGDIISKGWKPNIEWKGITEGSIEDVTITLDTSLSNADNFTITGDITFTADHLITLA